ncbi:MAG: hypothetical protein LBI31_03190 [Zoogloeaceae bacterium]|jgi:tetratricopeptide (TPR) repeat protein|nr:hypothetical protein [Zoogloeaceae bacterium]
MNSHVTSPVRKGSSRSTRRSQGAKQFIAVVISIITFMVVPLFLDESSLEAREEISDRDVKLLVIRGDFLGLRDRFEEAIAAYDDVALRFSNYDSPVIRGLAVMALFNKGVVLLKQNRAREAFAVYDDMALRFGNDDSPRIRELVAMALFNKGFCLGEEGKIGEAAAVYDDFVRRFEREDSPTMRYLVARARSHKSGNTGGKR